MSTKGIKAWNRGKKFPHNPEWEARRLAAVREAAAKKIWPKGYKRPDGHTRPMLEAVAKSRLNDPERFKNVSISNLPKDCNGSKNGNWKGGKTAKLRGMRFSQEAKEWREIVLDRDGHKCKLCGATEELQAHHIIPISECSLIAWVPMNGVTLCKKCHYENDEVWQGDRRTDMEFAGKPIALCFTIPHKFQTYSTVGNWQFTKDGVPVIFVSKCSNPDHETLIAVHELVEVFMCKKEGITVEMVDKFDKDFEAHRHPDSVEEPGDSLNAPYRKQHGIASGIERILGAELGVDWNKYADEVEAFF